MFNIIFLEVGDSSVNWTLLLNGVIDFIFLKGSDCQCTVVKLRIQYCGEIC